MNGYSDEEIVRAFKSYITKLIKHSAIDFIRKDRNKKYTEIAFNNVIDIMVSLSNYDEDTFLNSSDEIIFSNNKRKKAFYSLTKTQRAILLYTIKGLSDKEIAANLNTTNDSIRVQRNKARNRFKKYLEE